MPSSLNRLNCPLSVNYQPSTKHIQQTIVMIVPLKRARNKHNKTNWAVLMLCVSATTTNTHIIRKAAKWKKKKKTMKTNFHWITHNRAAAKKKTRKSGNNGIAQRKLELKIHKTKLKLRELNCKWNKSLSTTHLFSSVCVVAWWWCFGGRPTTIRHWSVGKSSIFFGKWKRFSHEV